MGDATAARGRFFIVGIFNLSPMENEPEPAHKHTHVHAVTIIMHHLRGKSGTTILMKV